MIPFVRDMRFEYGVADQVSPLIRRVVANNPGPFTYTGTGTYIVGHDHVAVIDPGPADDAHLAAILKAVGHETVSAILTTHTHADHSPLAHPLQRATGAPIYGRPDPSLAGGSGEAAETAFRPDIVIAEGDVVSGPGWSLEAIDTPGHASNHVAYALADEDALMVGDHIMGWSTTVVSPPDGDMGAYYASLDKVEARDFAILWPTHGPPIENPRPFIQAYRAHRLERERQVLDRLVAGDDTIGQMVPILYAAVSPDLHAPAARSLQAHLIHLVRSGKVETDGEAGLESRYRLAE